MNSISILEHTWEWQQAREGDAACEHLYRFEPDECQGGMYLTDAEGSRWRLRRCVLCSQIDKAAYAP